MRLPVAGAGGAVARLSRPLGSSGHESFCEVVAQTRPALREYGFGER